jgi:hypothetical protein
MRQGASAYGVIREIRGQKIFALWARIELFRF